jgi:hypothetical protein
MTKPRDVGERALVGHDRFHADARILPLHDTGLPHHADAKFLGLQALGEGLIGRINARPGLFALEQKLFAGL